jgi:hypothetical protein
MPESNHSALADAEEIGCERTGDQNDPASIIAERSADATRHARHTGMTTAGRRGSTTAVRHPALPSF